jgi:ABC-type spermidine/putrescine transport system permease subunit I
VRGGSPGWAEGPGWRSGACGTGNVIGDQFQQAQNQPFGSALAIALMAVLSVFVVVYILFARKEERFGG